MQEIKQFLNYLKFEKRYSVHTIKAYEIDLFQFNDFCEENSCKVLKADHKIISSWIYNLTANATSGKSINRKISSLKSFFRYFIKKERIRENPVEKVTIPKIEKTLPVFVDDKAMNSLLDEYEFGDDFEGVRNKLILELLYATGIRRSELINLKLNDYDKSNGSIKVLGKRNKERIIPLYNRIQKLIEEYIEQRDKFSGQYMFLTAKGNKIYEKLVYRIAKKYIGMVSTIEKKSPHILRHTFATQMLNNGADLNAIKELLGHANLAATQVYTHNTFEKLKKTYKQTHPRA